MKGIFLRKDPLHLFCCDQLPQGHDVGRHAERAVTLIHNVQKALEGSGHELFQHFVYLVTVPGQLLDVLHHSK